MFSIIKDFKAIFDRDPAAKTFFGWLEAILSNSGFHAIFFYRLAHFLHKIKIPIFPRLISQFVRWFTGVEIHPGATIAGGFFIDHGMGVVIGETTEIGENVTLYQGVTLGGTGKERGKRHPTIDSGVVVGAGAKVLGNITVGKNCKVGAGSVVIHPVPDGCTVVGVPGEVVRRDGNKVDALDHCDLPDPVEELRERIVFLQKEIDGLEKALQKKRKTTSEK